MLQLHPCGSPHSKSYAFDGKNFDLRARFERGAILLCKFRAPFLGTDSYKPTIAGNDALGDYAGAADDRVHVGRLMLYLEPGFEPIAKQREIKQREDGG